MTGREWTQAEIDDLMFDEVVDDDDEVEDDQIGEEDCGRWINGRLSSQCRKAGSEECDWLCPIGLDRRRSTR